MNAHHKKSTYKPAGPDYSPRLFTCYPHFEQAGGGQRWQHAISHCPFGWQLNSLIPSVSSSTDPSSTSPLPLELQQLVADSTDYYYCPNVNLANLLQPEFMNAFVRQGSLIGLSLEDGEGEDVVCLDGRGRLLLSVSKDTYEVLGLPGRASAYGSHRQRFIIEIDLKDPSFRSDKPGYERTRSLLSNWPRSPNLFAELSGLTTTPLASNSAGGKTFDMVFSFVDASDNPQPITFPPSITSHLRKPTLTITTTPSPLQLPDLTFLDDLSKEPHASTKRIRTSSGALRREPVEWQERSRRLREWLGLVANGAVDKIDGEEEGEREWGVEKEDLSGERGQVTSQSWTGFFHPTTMLKIADTVRKADHPRSATPFFTLSVTPFSHSPISHLSTQAKPVVGTSKKPNGRKVKRGRGRGEEEEKEAGGGNGWGRGGWEVLFGKEQWSLWEGA